MKPRAILVNPVFHHKDGTEYAEGTVYGSAVHTDGVKVRTSPIRIKDYISVPREDCIETDNSVYELVYNPWSNQLPDSEDNHEG